MSVAILDISLWFECPACEETLDLFCEKDCWATGSYGDSVLAWDMIRDWVNNKDFEPVTGECGKCHKEFTVDSIEY